MTSERGGRSCLLCGSRPVTGEHVFPKWLSSWMREQEGGYRYTLDTDIWGKWTSDILNLTSNRFCGPCNSEWMNQIEADARPLIKQMALGLVPRTIERDDQRTLAVWAWKTALTLLSTQHEPIRPPKVLYRAFRETRDPGAPMWLGAVDRPKELAVQFKMRGITWQPDEPVVGHVEFDQLFLIVGSLFFGTFYGIRSQQSIQMNMDKEFYLQLWPYRDVLQWPPENTVPRESLFAIDGLAE